MNVHTHTHISTLNQLWRCMRCVINLRCWYSNEYIYTLITAIQFNCCFACTVRCVQFNSIHSIINLMEEDKKYRWNSGWLKRDAKSRIERRKKNNFASEYLTKLVVQLLNMLRCFCSFIQETSFIFWSATSSPDCATAAAAAKTLLSIFCHF